MGLTSGLRKFLTSQFRLNERSSERVRLFVHSSAAVRLMLLYIMLMMTLMGELWRRFPPFGGYRFSVDHGVHYTLCTICTLVFVIACSHLRVHTIILYK